MKVRELLIIIIKKKNEDIMEKIINNLKQRIRGTIQKHNITHKYSFIKMFGCNQKEFEEHLRKQFTNEMSFENYGIYWELDHIFPISRYDLTDYNKFLKCFHYTNIYNHLSINANKQKSNKIDQENKKKKINNKKEEKKKNKGIIEP